MNQEVTTIPFLFVGNVLWLDFVNTCILQDGQSLDLLPDCAALRQWLHSAGILTLEQTREIDAKWSESDGQMALERVRAVRAFLRKTAEEAALKKEIPEESLSYLNALLRTDHRYRVLERRENRIVAVLRSAWESADDALLPVADSVVETLVSGDLSLLRKCENPQCVLFFYDTTKNHARRWCSMSACGNRHKQSAHYRRKQGAVSAG